MTVTADAVNGLFELVGTAFILRNVVQIRRDKRVMGVHWGATAFFTSWGLWNAWFYPHLGQWISFAGGICICAANLAWLGHLLAYSHRNPDVNSDATA